MISALHDERVNCWSFLIEMTVADYLKRVETAYENRGGLAHQRTSLRTASAKRIRSRMVKDLIQGAVLPPLVIGVVAPLTDNIAVKSPDKIEEFLSSVPADSLAIIDGMQRTTALQEATRDHPPLAAKRMRVEVWVADSTESLIYRMLVLNTGQVPWNLKQQLLVVYEPLVKEIDEKVSLNRLLSTKERRFKGGEFGADNLIETYIAFGLRKTEVDTQENLAEEFSKLDIADALAERRYDDYYFPIVQMMVNLDRGLSLFDPVLVAQPATGAGGGKVRRVYSRGKNIFDTQPPRIGFIVAAAVYVLGRIGMDRDVEKSSERLEVLQTSLDKLISRFSQLDERGMEDFLKLDVLQEKLQGRPSSAVGRWERAFWERAFAVLVDEQFDVPNMEPCWRAG